MFITIYKKHLKLLLLFTSIIFATLTLFVYLTLGPENNATLVEQMLHREQAIARSGAQSIKSFILSTANTLSLLTENEYVVNPQSSTTQNLLNQIINHWETTPLSLIAILDTQGSIISLASNQDYITNLSTSAKGRDYFEQGIKLSAHQYFVGQPIISKIPGMKNEYLIPISTPIYNHQNQLKGLLVGTFYLSDITKEYLNPLKISPLTDILLFDKKGYFLNSNYPQVIGVNVFDYIKQNPFLGDQIITQTIKNKLNSHQQEHKLDILIPNLTTNKLTRTLVATTPITINDSVQWILAIATPIDDALAFSTPFALKNLVLIISIFLVSITTITIFILLIHSKQIDTSIKTS